MAIIEINLRDLISKGLTPNQEGTLQELNERNNRPPELSEGAKTYIKEVWL